MFRFVEVEAEAEAEGRTLAESETDPARDIQASCLN